MKCRNSLFIVPLQLDAGIYPLCVLFSSETDCRHPHLKDIRGFGVADDWHRVGVRPYRVHEFDYDPNGSPLSLRPPSQLADLAADRPD